jgi:predicted GIY-YIG superfamily endonuclease
MYIYVIGNKENRQKIGFAKDPYRRLKTLQTGNPDKLYLHHYVEIPDEKTRIMESKIHSEISYKRITGEWFDISAEDAKLVLDHAVIRWLDDPLLY